MSKLKTFTILLLTVSFFFGCKEVEQSPFQFASGDLIFQDLNCGPLCDAIESVTPGLNGMKFSHVGMVIVVENKSYILEAISPKIQLTQVDSFLNRSMTPEGRPRIVVGRVKVDYSRIKSNALNSIESYLNQPYDDTFHINNGSFYCSELIYELFKDPTNKKSLFDLQPMTFKPPNSSEFNPAWVDYYQSFLAQIPEGQLGINPGLIANSDKIKIVYEPLSTQND